MKILTCHLHYRNSAINGLWNQSQQELFTFSRKNIKQHHLHMNHMLIFQVLLLPFTLPTVIADNSEPMPDKMSVSQSDDLSLTTDETEDAATSSDSEYQSDSSSSTFKELLMDHVLRVEKNLNKQMKLLKKIKGML